MKLQKLQYLLNKETKAMSIDNIFAYVNEPPRNPRGLAPWLNW